MRILRDLPVRRKLLLVSLSAGALALLVAGGGFLAYDSFTFRSQLVGRAQALSGIVANQCTAALSFQDREAAQEILDSLAAESDLSAARIYTLDGKSFASYGTDFAARASLPPSPGPDGASFEAEHLTVSRAVCLEQSRLGTVHLRFSLEGLRERALQNAIVMGGLLACSLLAAYLFTCRLVRVVTSPILDLAGTVKRVSQERDYGLRASEAGKDEVGILVAGFNEMLTQIHNRDLDLERGRQELERRVKDRTADLARVNATLKRSESRYRRIVECAADSFFVHDLEGRIYDVNGHACASLGYAREELLKKSMKDIDPAFSAEAVLKLCEGLKPAQPLTVEAVHRRKDGTTFPVEVRLGLFEQRERPLLLALTRDVSERRRLEGELRQAQKMEAVGRLAGGVAHDFNNLLTAILGYSELALANLEPSSPLRADLQEIRSAGERASSLTRQLLAFSRRQPVQPRVLDLNAVVTGIERLLRRVIPESIEIKTVLARNLPRVKADPTQIDQVIMNLSVNARDAMSMGGKIRIGTSAVLLDDDFVRRHPGALAGSFVAVSVSDTGVGIPTENLPHLFEPFFTTKETGKGTGLGLATVYGITKQNGGFVTVSSELGQGTTFTVFLPTTDEGAATASDSQVLTPVGGTETILLVEDESAVRCLVRHCLKSAGYKVIEASDPASALALVESGKESFDLLLTDLVMPGMSGRELAEKLRQKHGLLTVLYMSGYTRDESLRLGKLEEGAAFLTKPFTPSELLAKVARILSKKGTSRKALCHN